MNFIHFCVTLSIFVPIKILSSDLPQPQCQHYNTAEIQCDANHTNYFFFLEDFFSKFNLIYISRDNATENVEIVGCSCKTMACELFCCYANAQVINFKQCPRNNVGTRELIILEDVVDIFEYNFGWPDYNETWQLCNRSHPFLDDSDTRVPAVVLTARSFLTYISVFSKRVMVAKCIPIEAHAIPIPFDIFTIIVYVTLPNLRNVHGMCLVCLEVCFIICNIAMIRAYSTDYEEREICNVISFFSYWASMTKESWMFTIGFDLWKTFCYRLSPRRREEFQKTFRTMVAYSLLAWGTPLMVILILWTLYSEPPTIDYIESNFSCREVNCCYAKLLDLEDVTLYAYIESVFVGLNLCFLIHTFKKIHDTEREINSRNGRVNRGTTRNQQIIDHFCKFVRLFVIMQAAWIISKITQYLQEIKYLSVVVWQIDVFVQAATGMTIFFLFTLKRSIRNEFWNRVKRICSTSGNPIHEFEVRTIQTISQ